jgi:hypothetical protein
MSYRSLIGRRGKNVESTRVRVPYLPFAVCLVRILEENNNLEVMATKD